MPISVIIPAYRAESTIGETVRSARAIPEVSEVIVVDDGSGDGTAEAGRRAGADRVLVLPRNRGKAAALLAGVEAARHDHLLFLDADLGLSAENAGPLLGELGGRAAMAIAVLPKGSGPGGFGLARGLAASAIRLFTGLRVKAPLSGQRALPAALVRHVGLAPRFGVETGLTVEVAHLGLPIAEVPLALTHQHTGRTASAFLHRGRQLKDILRYALLTGYGLGWPALPTSRTALRIALWLFAIGAVIAVGAVATPSLSGLLAAVAACALLAWLPSLWVSAVWLGLRKPNYLGRLLPAAAGLVFPVVALPAVWFSLPQGGERNACLIVVGLFGLVGLLDDLFAPRRQARGLGGHLLALLRGRLTTGAVKALGGLAAGLCAGLLLAPGQLTVIALDALLIALSANFVNLLDLRPSRALKGFGLLCAAAIAISPTALPLVGPLLVAAVIASPAEFAGRIMLGDVGANVLGGAAGLGLAVALSPWQRLVAVLLLALVHLAAARASLSELIARRRLLAAVDRLGTAHLAPFETKGRERRES